MREIYHSWSHFHCGYVLYIQIEPATIAAISFQHPKRSRDIETEGIAATDLQSSKIPKVVVNQAEAERDVNLNRFILQLLFYFLTNQWFVHPGQHSQ